MLCAKCQHTNRPNAKFCARCRARLQPVCPACGEDVAPDDRYCSECGADLVSYLHRLNIKRVAGVALGQARGA